MWCDHHDFDATYYSINSRQTNVNMDQQRETEEGVLSLDVVSLCLVHITLHPTSTSYMIVRDSVKGS
jgi:hypothetical protein